MRNIQSMDDIKQVSERITLPDIDVRASVMQKINRTKKEKNVFNGRKTVISIIVATFLICSVGFAANKIWELRGPGNETYKFQILDENHTGTEKSELVQSAWAKVKPGGVLAVLKTKDNPSFRIGVTRKPLVLQSLDELKEKVGMQFKEPLFIPNGYSFKEGQINAGINESIRNEMIEESKKSNIDTVTRVIDLSDNVQFYSIVYKNQKKEISVTLNFNWKGKQLAEKGEEQNVSKININNFEAVYTVKNGRGEIKWIGSNNGSDILYVIGCSHNNVTKDELMEFAESMN